jgi:hypothetical protein
MNSSFLNINLKDLGKGLIVAVLTSVLTIVYNTVESGNLTFDWKLIATTAITTGIGYLLKNLLTNSQGETFKAEK